MPPGRMDESVCWQFYGTAKEKGKKTEGPWYNNDDSCQKQLSSVFKKGLQEVEIGGKVIDGGREICSHAGITLAGGHSIDSPEPIFGLSVSGIVEIKNLKKNIGAKIGDTLFLTKPLGIGVLATAQKKKLVSDNDHNIAVKQMSSLNDIGAKLAAISGINAVTDVTGFGLAGHLLEVCRGFPRRRIMLSWGWHKP